MMKNLSAVTLLLAAILMTGCREDPLGKVQVRGVVTFDGGPCPAEGRVTFSPIESAPGFPSRPASGAFEKDGAYVASSFRPGDGVVPGRYAVGVVCVDPSMLSSAPSDDEYRRASFVAEGFEPEQLVVEAVGGAVEFNLDVPRREPGE